MCARLVWSGYWHSVTPLKRQAFQVVQNGRLAQYWPGAPAEWMEMTATARAIQKANGQELRALRATRSRGSKSAQNGRKNRTRPMFRKKLKESNRLGTTIEFCWGDGDVRESTQHRDARRGQSNDADETGPRSHAADVGLDAPRSNAGTAESEGITDDDPSAPPIDSHGSAYVSLICTPPGAQIFHIPAGSSPRTAHTLRYFRYITAFPPFFDTFLFIGRLASPFSAQEGTGELFG
ncbi:hypothetical protein B0H14DRAFT_2559041 [Mycena olivaceomarginata]|nr:hypothetical protein B0H14DRAFT_2559041 [Mycena olivaceomarginata]